MRCFSKEVPKTPIWLPDGTALKFDSLDGQTGYHATDNPQQIEWLKKLEAEHRGGVREITPQVYEVQYLKKKPGSLSFNFNSLKREEISPGTAPDTVATPTRVPPLVADLAATEQVVDTPAPKAPARTAVQRGPRVGKRSRSTD